MTRVLVLSRYDQRGASSRLRVLRFLPELERRGFRFDVRPFFGEGYLEALYGGRRPSARAVLADYGRRLAALRGPRPDLIWMEKEILPWMPHWVERLALPRGLPYVVDFDDAWALRYAAHRLLPVRWILGDKFRGLVRGAARVVAGNAVLEAWARDLGAPRVVRIPTVVDPTRYAVTPPPEGPFTIGWIGTPVTAPYLQTLAPALRRVAASGPLRLRVVGDPAFAMEGVTVEALPWSEETETTLLSGIHAGIMPLPDAPWERGKCGYKLIQYMAAGRPVVASPVGANRDIVTPDVGLLAGGDDDWVSALERLRGDAPGRARMGAAARAEVEAHYALGPRAADLAEILAAAASGG